MIKSRIIDSFFKKNVCDEDDKKMHICHLNLRNFTIIQKFKKIKNDSLKFPELHIMNLKILKKKL